MDPDAPTAAPPWTPAGHAARGRPELAVLRRYEDLAHRSWPALETAPLGGWHLRAAAGITRRANSAWPRRPGTLAVERQLAAVRSWYGQRGLPPRVQLSPASEPPDLADRLVGWHLEGGSLVLSGPLTVSAAPAVSVTTWPGEDWLTAAAAAYPHQFGPEQLPTSLAVLRKISGPTAYALAHEDGVPVAVARGVLDGRTLGVFTVGTLPDRRRRGHARALLGALSAWAAAQGASSTWLQVEAANAPARALYAHLEPVYEYAYATWTG